MKHRVKKFWTEHYEAIGVAVGAVGAVILICHHQEKFLRGMEIDSDYYVTNDTHFTVFQKNGTATKFHLPVD